MIPYNIIFICLTILTLSNSCKKPNISCEPALMSINIIDRNGFSETISSNDRLKQYEKVDFLCEQPYQKVLRVYSRDACGNINACITSYHPNGHIKQYLDVVNNRAFGAYREWHENGNLKVETYVLGGEADINTSAEKSWLFDGCSQVWNEDGLLIAQIRYTGGVLEGMSTYYHNNGAIWKQMPFHKGQLEGTAEVFMDDGVRLQTTAYINGIKNGLSQRFWDSTNIAAEECYEDGLLITGTYYNFCGEVIASITEGVGYRAVFGKESISELQEYRNGILEGEIQVFGPKGYIIQIYHMKRDRKHGEELNFFPPNEVGGKQKQRQLSINWVGGKIQGLVKTWYANGVQESQREMGNNTKNGLLTAWYEDGSVMLIESYDHDKLVKGEYFMRGEKNSISEVMNGKGTATLFDNNGNLLQRITYNNGKPILE